MEKLYVAVAETGDKLEEVNSIQEGLDLIAEYERTDQEDGSYLEGFYNLVNEDYETVNV